MLKMFWINGVVALVILCAGCESGEATSTVENADQSAIEAYQAAQKADQEAMDASLGKPNAGN